MSRETVKALLAADEDVGQRPAGALASVAIMRYQWRWRMTDMLIRDVPDDVIAAVDAHARRLGLSRTEYVRRRLAQGATASRSPAPHPGPARLAPPLRDP